MAAGFSVLGCALLFLLVGESAKNTENTEKIDRS